jgi:hypothetical protein
LLCCLHLRFLFLQFFLGLSKEHLSILQVIFRLLEHTFGRLELTFVVLDGVLGVYFFFAERNFALFKF